MKGAKVLYSHKDDEHVTDPKIIDRLEKTFNISFDPCPSPYFLHRQFETNKEVDSSTPWWPNVPIFINPPYSQLDQWIDAAISQFEKYPENPIIMLLPARTDRPWFEKAFNHAHAIGFVRLRLKFMLVDPEKKGVLIKSKWTAPFPSMFVVFETNVSISRNAEIIECLDDLNCVSLVLKETDNNVILNT